LIDSEKGQFKAMMKALTALYGKQELDTELLRIWWHKLSKFEFHIVTKSFDKWIDSNKRMPVPADILELCKAQVDRNFSVRIGRKFTPEEKERNRMKLREVMSELKIIQRNA
jgi:hypothetical protein